MDKNRMTSLGKWTFLFNRDNNNPTAKNIPGDDNKISIIYLPLLQPNSIITVQLAFSDNDSMLHNAAGSNANTLFNSSNTEHISSSKPQGKLTITIPEPLRRPSSGVL